MVDEGTKKTLASFPLLRTNAGPRDGAQWASRLKEEYLSLIKVLIKACLLQKGILASFLGHQAMHSAEPSCHTHLHVRLIPVTLQHWCTASLTCEGEIWQLGM